MALKWCVDAFPWFKYQFAFCYGSPGGTFLLITYHLLLTTYYLSLITYNLLLFTYYLLLITYHIIYNPNNDGKLHCTFPVKVVVVVVAVVVVVYV